MITIYDIDGKAILSVPVTKDCVHEEEMMKSNFVRLSWNDRNRRVLPVGAYILIRADKTAVLDGETIGKDEEIIKYRLFDPYVPQAEKYKHFKYSPEFQHPVLWLGRIPFFHLQGDTSSEETLTKKYDWTYSGYATTIAAELVKFINTLAKDDAFKEVFGDGWTAKVAENLTSTASCSFSSVDVLSAAAEIANKFDCEYHFDFKHKIFFLGNHGTDFTLSLEDDTYKKNPLVLKSGDNVGVVSVSKSKEDYHNAFVVQGSTRNLSQVSASGDNVQVTERLHLDSSYTDSIIYVDNEGKEMTRDEFIASGLPMLTKELIFDDVYPKLDLYLYNIRERKCWLLDGDTGEKIPDPNQDNPTKSSQMVDGIYYKTYSKWYFRLAYKAANEWKDYLIKDDVFCFVTDKKIGTGFYGTANAQKLYTSLQYDSSYFTNDRGVAYFVNISCNNHEGTALVGRDENGFAFLVLLEASSTIYASAEKGDKVMFLDGVDSTRVPASNKNSVLIKDKTLSIAFQPNYDSKKYSSPLAGREFELVYFKEKTKEREKDDISDKAFEANEGDYRIVFVEEDYVIPTPKADGLYPQGDNTPSTENNKATLFNIAVDDAWKATAQAELKETALAEIAYLFSDLNTYSFNSNPVKFKADNPNLQIGQRIIYNNGQDLVGKESYTLNTLVRKLVTRLDHPQIVSIIVGNEKAKGNVQTMKEQIEALIVGGYGGGSGGGISESQFLQLLKNYGNRFFLSKLNNDTASGEISLKKGLTTGSYAEGESGGAVDEEGNAEFADETVRGKLTAQEAEVKDALTVGGTTTAQGDLLAQAILAAAKSGQSDYTAVIKAFINIIQSGNYNGDGPFDEGWMVTNSDANRKSYMVVDNLFVRMKAIFTELEIRKLSYAGGNIVFSHAGSELVDVKEVKERGAVAYWRCYIKKDDGTSRTANWWKVDDQARCQTFNIDGTGTYHNVSNSYYWRRVVGVGTERYTKDDGTLSDEDYDYIDLSATDCDSGSTIPEAGDTLVQMGNRTDTSRQGFITIEVWSNDGSAPALKVYKNVNSYSLTGKRPIIISPKLTEMSLQKYVIETAYDVQQVPMERGEWDDITETDGGGNTHAHRCYYYNLVQHNGATWLCIYPESGINGVLYTTEEPTDDAEHWQIYAARGAKGEKGEKGDSGASFSVLGTYASESALKSAHPTGKTGEGYMVGGDLYVWDSTNSRWSNSGRIQGATGAKGDKGDTGEKGATGNGIKTVTISYGVSASQGTRPTAWAASESSLTIPQGSYLWTRTVATYTNGDSTTSYQVTRFGVDGSYKSTAFARTNTDIRALSPSGGTWANPLPDPTGIAGTSGKVTWSDGIPQGTEMLWMTSAVFKGDGTHTAWSHPSPVSDTDTLDIEFSPSATQPSASTLRTSPTGAHPSSGVWFDPGNLPVGATMIWRAERKISNGAYDGDWVITRIYGEKGEKGAKGEKGEKGDSITKKSETVTYATDTQGTTPPTSGWQTAKPPVSEGAYLWTRTIITWSDDTTTTLHAAERNPNDGKPGQDISVDKQTLTYALSDSGTSRPADSSFGSYPSTLTQGKWLWTKTVTTYKRTDGTSAGSTSSYSVSYISKDGAAGRGVSSVTEYYLASAKSTGVKNTDSGFTTDVQTTTKDKPYLWNYEVIKYTSGTPSEVKTDAVLIGNFSADGRGIDSVTNHYLASAKATGVAKTESGWTTSVQSVSAEKPYLWNYETITYTNGTPTESEPHVVGHYGKDGENVTVDESQCKTEYAVSTSPTTAPASGWQPNVPAPQKGQYLWTRVTTAYSNNEKTVAYSVAYSGSDGTPVSVKSQSVTYAVTRTGVQPADTAFTHTALPSTLNQGDYLWVKSVVVYSDGTELKSYSVSFLGTDGKKGNPGVNGATTHFAYATSADGMTNFSTTNFKGATHIGTYTDEETADSTDPSRYTWTEWKGEKGDLGRVCTLSLAPEVISIPTDTAGKVLESFSKEVDARLLVDTAEIQQTSASCSQDGGLGITFTPRNGRKTQMLEVDMSGEADVESTSGYTYSGTKGRLVFGGAYRLEGGRLYPYDSAVTGYLADVNDRFDRVIFNFRMGWGNKKDMGTMFTIYSAGGSVLAQLRYARWDDAGNNGNTLGISNDDLKGYIGPQYDNAPIVDRYTAFEVEFNFATGKILTTVSYPYGNKSGSFTADIPGGISTVGRMEVRNFGVGNNQNRAGYVSDWECHRWNGNTLMSVSAAKGTVLAEGDFTIQAQGIYDGVTYSGRASGRVQRQYVSKDGKDGKGYSENILRGTGDMCGFEASGSAWEQGLFRSASGGNAERTPFALTDAPQADLKMGMRISKADGHTGQSDVAQDNAPVLLGRTYTLSVWVRGTGTAKLQYWHTSDGVSKKTVVDWDDWRRIAFTFTPGAKGLDAAGRMSNLYFGATGASPNLEFCGFKLEEGEVAAEDTRWTPSPWDLESVSVGLSAPVLIFNQDPKTGNVGPAENVTEVVVNRGGIRITSGIAVTVNGTENFNTSGVTVNGTSVTLAASGITTYKETINNVAHTFPQEEGEVLLNINYGGKDYPLSVRFFCNAAGRFATVIEGDVETSIAQKKTYVLNGDVKDGSGQTVTTYENLGKYLRSSEQNVSTLTQTVNGVVTNQSEINQQLDKIGLSVYEAGYTNLFTGNSEVTVSPRSTTATIPTQTVQDEGLAAYIRIPITLTGVGKLAVKVSRSGSAGSETGGYVEGSLTRLTATSATVTLDNATWEQTEQRSDGTLLGYLTIKGKFSALTPRETLTATATADNNLTAVLRTGRTFNIIEALGDDIDGLNSDIDGIKDGLVRTGIDIEKRKITFTADTVAINNNAGVNTAGFDKNGNFSVAGVINQRMVAITTANRNGYGLMSGSHYFINPLLLGNIVTINFACAIVLPNAYAAGGSATTATINGRKENGSTFTLSELRQMVGKRIYILPGSSSGTALTFAQNASTEQAAPYLLRVKERRIVPLYTSGSSTAYPNVATQVNDPLGQTFVNDNDHFEETVVHGYNTYNAQQPTHFHILECKLGSYLGKECIYWEIETSGQILTS